MWESKKQYLNGFMVITVDVPRIELYYQRIHDIAIGYEALDNFIKIIRDTIYSINSQNVIIRCMCNPMKSWEELTIEYKDTITAYRIPYKDYETFTLYLVDDIVRDWNERINYKPKPKPPLGRLRPLKCTECGGTIDLQTLTCNFCGMRFYMEGVFDGTGT